MCSSEKQKNEAFESALRHPLPKINFPWGENIRF